MDGRPAEQEAEPEVPTERPLRSAPPVRRWSRPGLLLVVWALVVAAVFFVGLVVGRTIEDAPNPGGSQTIVRTLEPSTVGPAVTVTVTEP
jgi:hypothetical protein